MRVPVEWLNAYVQVGTNSEEIGMRLTMGGSEVEGNEPPEEVYRQAVEKKVEPDAAAAAAELGRVLDVYVTPNRGDCNSLIGIAREVAALYGLPLYVPQPPASEPGGVAAEQTSVVIEAPDLCPRYAARLVRGVKVGPSPRWMQARLAAAGMRPINNIVDVTNYVMLEMGQPLHAFDLDKLTEQRIVVRRAKEGESLRTLDGMERALSPEMLIIADAVRPVAVAGVMGGADSEVSETTVNLLLESAHFDPLAVRRASRALELRTEASYRFERIVDPNGVVRALDRICELLVEMGQPEAVRGVVDVYPNPIAPRKLTLRASRAAALLGIKDITPEVATKCLQRLGLSVEREDADVVRVTIPTFRPDLTIEEDLVEEVGRIYGYENIPETLPGGSMTTGGDSAEGKLLTRIRQIFVGCGMQECISHSLCAPSPFDAPDDATRKVAIRNALSAEVSGLRRSLLTTLLHVAAFNVAQSRPSALALFEVGRVWQNEETDGMITPQEYLAVAGLLSGTMQEAGWQRDAKPVTADFAYARGVVERLLQSLAIRSATFLPPGNRADAFAQFHPGRMATLHLGGEAPDGILGEIHPRIAARYGFRDRVYVFEISLEALRRAMPVEGPRFQPLTKFPAVARDLAPRVPETVSYREIEAAIRSAEASHLEAFRLTDLFRGAPLPEGIKSITLSFTFRSAERTLSDTEVNDALDRLRAALISRCQAQFPA
jgi:phenylalanyl-tRNA synthetase beta chain